MSNILSASAVGKNPTKKYRQPLRKPVNWAGATAIAVLVIAGITILIPILWLFLSSFKYFKDIITAKLIFTWNLDNYRSLFSNDDSFFRIFLNTVTVSFFSMVLCALLSAFAAYSLVRMPWRRGVSTSLKIILLSLEIIPSITIIIPLYTIGMQFNMIDTRFFLVLIYALFNAPFIFFLMSSNYGQIPAEIEESGFIDGASRLIIFTRLVLPLTIPILMTGALLSFIFVWKEFLLALSLTSTPAAMTINVKIAGFIQSYSVKYGEMAASASLGAIPGILLCIFTQQYIVSGITQGSVKG
ncbi:MAG: carbohydrate ABC transporter permease [Spirochaetia bacterium]|nr:carbohydrate ABC transporter permease [Spirochaetia bacterium]